jgi:predicted 3-demethylubiquinone-9 3-methyltransferase (glyoxalase superfamily)
MPAITPFLWFDTEGQEAAEFYTSVFPNSRITDVALNGGPDFTFNEAVSFLVSCKDQEEVDHYWNTLSEGGEEGPCGWLKDRYGLSWQVVPTVLDELLTDPDREKAQRVMAAMMKMGKIEIEGLERAAAAA